MTLSEKTQQEKIVFDLFRKAYINFPKAKVSKAESPDFILQISPKRKIGIELTELIQYEQNSKNLIYNSIERLIDKKEEKIELYQKRKLDKIWLLIHTDNMEKSVFEGISKKLGDVKVNGGFNKIFIFELFDKKLLEIL